MKKKSAKTEETAAEAVAAEEVSPHDAAIARKALLEAVEGTNENNDSDEAFDSAQPFLNLFTSCNTTKQLFPGINIRVQRQILYETIASFNKAKARRFFAGLHTIVLAVLDNEAFDVVPDETDPKYIDPDLPDTIFYAAMTVKAYLKGLVAAKTSSSNIPLKFLDEAFAVAHTLHEHIFVLRKCLEAQAGIVSMCEALWLANTDRKRMVVAAALTILISSAAAVAEETFAKDVKRLYSMKEAIGCVDFSDKESEESRKLLLSSASSPLCLKQPEGVKLLAYMLQCDPTLRNDLHLAIRAQIPQQKKNFVRVYGEVYYSAWKGLSDENVETREDLEDLIGQYLIAMLHAKHASLNKNLLTFMEPFHQNQKTPAVEDLLHRLYGPILWRALSARNFQVRIYALKVLGRVFPLQDSSHCRTEQAFFEATKALDEGLSDDCPSVRMAAAETVGMVLTEFWTALPSASARNFLNHLIFRHVSDATSSGVRATAVDAITMILQNNKSHAVLRELLPRVGISIHDKAEKVRMAVVRMLLYIKRQIHFIKYYHVVPEASLVGQMAQDGLNSLNGPVVVALTGLLANAYLPQGSDASGTKQSETIVNFLSSHPSAAKAFFSNLAEHMSVKSIVELLCKLFKLFSLAIFTELAASKKVVIDSKGQKRIRLNKAEHDQALCNDRDQDDHDEATAETISAANTLLMASLAETIDILWQSIHKTFDRKENKEYQGRIVAKFSEDSLLGFINHFERKAQLACSFGHDKASATRENCHRVIAAILRCAGRLSPETVHGLMRHISSALKKVAQDYSADTSPRQATSYIALLCLWDMTEAVGMALGASIESVFERDHSLHYDSLSSPQHSRKRRTAAPSRNGGNIKKLGIPDLPPLLALAVLGNILNGFDPSSIAARELLLKSTIAITAIQKSLERAIKYAELVLTGTKSGTLHDDELEFILRACELFGRLVLHAEATDDSNHFSDDAKQLLDWTSTRVLGAFSLPTHCDDIGFDEIVHTAKAPSSPMSPIPVGQPRRRTNRNKTPSKEPDHELSNARDRAALIAVARAFATSLLQASCVIFSEWLAVGCSGGEEIARAAQHWTRIFCIDEAGAETQQVLLPTFSRLGVQLAKNTGDLSLLKSLLIECNEDLLLGDASFQRVFSVLLATASSPADALLGRIVFDAAIETVHRRSISISLERPASVGDFCSVGLTRIEPAVTAILSNKNACVELAKAIVNDVMTTLNEDIPETDLIFKIKFLFLICDHCAVESRIGVTSAIHQLLSDGTQFDDEVEAALQELVAM